MSEAVFPLLGPVLVFALVLPLSALLAKLLLWPLGLRGVRGLHVQNGARYTVLVASSAAPLAWFVSASLHQAEDGRSALVCIAEHAPEAFCTEAAYFALALALVAGACALPRLLCEQFVLRASHSAEARAVEARLERCILRWPGLSTLSGRVVVSDMATTAIATLGILSPRVVVETRFAEALDDAALAAALHHEVEHLRARDPLRYFVAWWALSVNPLGRRLLGGEYARWLLGHELYCDRQAVLAGASPAALAQALVVAARRGQPASGAALGAGHVEGIKLRLAFLLAYADQRPSPRRVDFSASLLLPALVLVLLLPHGGGTSALDTIHAASESAAALLIGN